MMYKFSPKKPVRSFRDLEVYQTTLACSVIVMKDIVPQLEKLKCPFAEAMVDAARGIPLSLATAHSLRFGDHANAILILERAMAGCNKMAVYLEHAKGIYGAKLDASLLDDLVRRYETARVKIFRLEKAWQKFTPPRA
jgi:hypothetical protein